MIWKKFNDQFAILGLILIVALWIADPIFAYYFKIGMNESVIGATVAIATLMFQFYFRRKEPDNGNGGGTP